MDSKKERVLNKIRVLLLRSGIVFFLIALVCLIGFGVMQMVGKNSLKDKGAYKIPNLESTNISGLENQEMVDLQAGQVSYNGKIYEYNDNLLNFLCLGVDSRQDILLEKTPGTGGQADTILLVVVDEDSHTLKMINVSRDTVTTVDVYDTNGIYSGSDNMQLALQYAYGDGKASSCELMVDAVSNLFYGIPIHGYGAIDVNAVADLNDAVGGVEVTVLEDLSRFTPTLALGNTVTLSGREALHYVQERQVETDILGANNLRIERQKQYLTSFFNKVKEETKGDLGLPLELYQTASSHMVTNIGADEVAYLSTIVLDCTFQDEDMISVLGSIEKDGVYEKFYIDEDAFFALMLDVFYRELE